MSEKEVSVGKTNDLEARVLEGTVVSNKMDKTITVLVSRRSKHPRYQKLIMRTTKIKAHDEGNSCGIGDLVKIVETKPYSKTKAWKFLETVEKAV